MKAVNVVQAGQDISHRISNDILHISLQKHFDIPHAQALVNLLTQYHQSCKRIFVDVSQVEKPHPVAATAFKEAWRTAPYSPRQILFKGSSGFELAVDGNRVLVNGKKAADHGRHEHMHGHHDQHGKSHVCCGKCANCRCGKKKKRRNQ